MSSAEMKQAAGRARVIDVHAHCVLEETFGTAGRAWPRTHARRRWRADVSRRRLSHGGGALHRQPLHGPRRPAGAHGRSGHRLSDHRPNPLTYFHYIDAADALAFCRRHNDAIAAVAARYPQRLAAIAALPIQDPAAAARELRRAVTELGLLGAQIGTDAPTPLHGADFDPLYEAFQDVDVPLFLHPNNAGIDGPPGDPNLTRFDLATAFGYAAQETIAVATLIFGCGHGAPSQARHLRQSRRRNDRLHGRAPGAGGAQAGLGARGP